MLNRFFHLRENGTSVRTELVAGATTFLTMAYIIFVNPMILADAGRHIGVAVFRAVTNLALCDGDVTNMALLADAERLWNALVPEQHAIRLHMRRARAAFALDTGDTATAQRELEAAIAGFETNGALSIDLAIARAELAEVLRRRSDAKAARVLLGQALPVLREALLPTEIARADAERTAAVLGLR